jgi:hypothetical protein
MCGTGRAGHDEAGKVRRPEAKFPIVETARRIVGLIEQDGHRDCRRNEIDGGEPDSEANLQGAPELAHHCLLSVSR